MSFFEELKRRNVVRVAVAYGIAAWVLLQVADLVLEAIEAPSWVLQALMLVVGLGFIAAVVIAWAYEITPEGIKKESEVDRSTSITNVTGRKLDRIIIGFLVLAVAYFAWESRFAQREASPQPALKTAQQGQTDSAAEAGGQAPEPAATGVAPDRSIAVLPFANRSLQQEDLFFTDGIHDDLLTQLAKISGLKVISRTSMMKYRDTEKTIPEIAAELGVATILEGGVQRAGNRVRINAQLINVTTDEHIWAETFDREMTVENIFDIQSEITRHIVSAVRGELSEAESRALEEFPTSNLQAYEAYLQVRNIVSRPDYAQENYIEARPWAERAVALDPEFSEAWASLAKIHGMALWMGFDNTPERLAAMKQALGQAVLLDPDSPWTLFAQAEYKYRAESDFAAALAFLEKAREQLPGDVEILEQIGVTQRRLGKWDESVASFLEALELDPGNSRSATLAIETLDSMKDWDRVLSLTEAWTKRFPEARDLQVSRALAFVNKSGDLETARALFDRVPENNSDDYLSYLALLSFLERDFEATIKALNIPEVMAIGRNRGWLGWREFYLGVALEALGQAEEAEAAFRKGLDAFADWNPTGVRNTDGWDLVYQALLHAELGHEQEALEMASRAVNTVPESVDALNGPQIAALRAQALALVGHRDEALAEIERLLPVPAGPVKWQLNLDPSWDFFRDDPRFVALVTPEGVMR